jgi:hypothetical protein
MRVKGLSARFQVSCFYCDRMLLPNARLSIFQLLALRMMSSRESSVREGRKSSFSIHIKIESDSTAGNLAPRGAHKSEKPMIAG